MKDVTLMKARVGGNNGDRESQAFPPALPISNGASLPRNRVDGFAGVPGHHYELLAVVTSLVQEPRRGIPIKAPQCVRLICYELSGTIIVWQPGDLEASTVWTITNRVNLRVSCQPHVSLDT
jgi:hypothetical protein